METEMLKKKPGMQMNGQEPAFSEQEKDAFSYGGNQSAMVQMQAEKLENPLQTAAAQQESSLLQGQNRSGLRPLSNVQAPVLQGKWNKPWRKKGGGNTNATAAPAQPVDPVTARKREAYNKFNFGNLYNAANSLHIAQGSMGRMNETAMQAVSGIRDKANNKEAYETAMREGENNPQYLEAMRAEAGEFFGDNLNAEEAVTVLDYTAAQSSLYNAVGRRPGAMHDSDTTKKVDILSGALQKYELQHSMRVYRVIDKEALAILIGVDDLSLLTPETIKAHFVGTIIQEKGFMSTSVNPKHSWSGDVKMVIDVPAGAKGAPIMGMSSNPNEDEYLFDMGAKMEITDASEAGDMLQVNCRMLEQSEGEER